MKRPGILFLMLLFICRSAYANPADTIINGISIRFSYTSSPFPVEWQGNPINGSAKLIDAAEIPRSKAVIATSLKKYPAKLLELNLKTVYFFKKISFYGIDYGGTNSTDIVYVMNNGVYNGCTDTYLEQTFHHEFSSILFRNYLYLFDTMAWKAANIPGFDYNDPEAGVGAIRNNEASQVPDSILSEKGFLTQYALSGMENDINTIAQNLFKPDAGFWRLVDKYPRLNKKTKLLIAFYNKLSSLFTESVFRQYAK